MAVKKALLIYPAPISQMPSGIAYLGAILEQRGINVDILVNSFRKIMSSEDIYRYAERTEPDIIGLSFITYDLINTYELLGRLKTLGVPVVCGGVHPTARPEESLNAGASVIVMNEGELTIEALVDHWDNPGANPIEAIPGIAYRQNGENHTNLKMGRVADLDAIPYPARHLFDADQFRLSNNELKGFERLFSGRGCPSKCTFCDKTVFGRKFKTRSVENVIGEIEQVKKDFGIRSFSFGDDTLTLDKRFVNTFCEEILKRDLDIEWNCSTRVDRVNSEMATMMKRAGCFRITLGPESGHPDTLLQIKKGITVDDIYNATNVIYDAGIQAYLNFMCGFPEETPERLKATIKVIRDLSPKVYMYQVYGAVVPYPNTEVYTENYEKFGFKDWWLEPEMQGIGMAMYQNVKDPYHCSVYYQRSLFDDTYIMKETFFPYSKEFKKTIKEMIFAVGKHSLAAQYRSRAKQYTYYLLGHLSKMMYDLNPNLEISLVSTFARTNLVHENRSIGSFVQH